MSLAGSAQVQSGQSVQQTSIPTLAAPFDPVPTDGADTPRASESNVGGDGKKKKRTLFGFGKKKADEVTDPSSKADPAAPRPPEKDIPARKATSPIQTEHSYRMPASPGRALSSSPAGSQIFERDVQESTVNMPNSPAIPSHITTENHIPPVLDASSEAITAEDLDPDSVEIITHTGHQPAAVTVTGVPPASALDSMSASWAEELASFASDKEDNASNYGSLDATDVRRLSFISFADVVQAEQTSHAGGVAGSRDSIHLAGLTSLAAMGVNRSPSPIRSPVSSQGPGTSPPTSKSGSIKGLELSPSRKPLGTPASPVLSTHGAVTGELNIETMSQALRRTGSADFSGVKSLPTSPVEGPTH